MGFSLLLLFCFPSFLPPTPSGYRLSVIVHQFLLFLVIFLILFPWFILPYLLCTHESGTFKKQIRPHRYRALSATHTYPVSSSPRCEGSWAKFRPPVMGQL